MSLLLWWIHFVTMPKSLFSFLWFPWSQHFSVSLRSKIPFKLVYELLIWNVSNMYLAVIQELSQCSKPSIWSSSYWFWLYFGSIGFKLKLKHLWKLVKDTLMPQQYPKLQIKSKSKPLIWDLVKDTERFQFVSADQVKHIVINMTVSHEEQDGIWEE